MENKMSKRKTASLQDKVRGLYSRIGDDFYLCRDDLSVGGEDYNSALLFGVLTELNKGKELIYGEPGRGKTTSAEYLHSLFHGLPLDLVKSVALRGHPQLTEEKIIARPDYGALHQGEEKVLWLPFTQIGPKIIDEINRIPETNQSMLLDGVERGNWAYMNDTILTGRQPLIATSNYADRGNNEIVRPLLDRFDVAVESGFPGVANDMAIAFEDDEDRNEVISNPQITMEAMEIMNSGRPYHEVQEELKQISEGFRGQLKKNGFPTLTDNERERIRRKIRTIPLDKDADQYFMFLDSELNVSAKHGQKRSIDPPSAEHGKYLDSTFIGSGSARSVQAIAKYAQALAWLQDKDEVNLDHIAQVAPYALWHKVNWTDETINRFRSDDREDALDLYITKQLLGEGTGEIPGVKRRFVESQENYQRVLDLVKHGKLDEAVEYARECGQDGKGHPIFKDTLEDLGDGTENAS